MEIKTIESEKYKQKEDGLLTFVGMKSHQEVFDELEQHLKDMNLLPDEYFAISFANRDKILQSQ